MIWKILCSFILITLITSTCFAQENTIQLIGTLKGKSIDVSSIVVTNKNLNIHKETNEFGVFEIPVRLGDSIVVSAVHIQKETLIISKKIVLDKKVNIELTSQVNLLEEVVLNSVLSDAALDFSAAYKPDTNPDLIAMRKQEDKNFGNVDPLASSNNSSINILAVFSLVSKLFKKKTKSKREKIKEWNTFTESIIEEFGVSFFTEELHLSEIKINEFLMYCSDQKDIVKLYTNKEKLVLMDLFYKEINNYNAARLKK